MPINRFRPLVWTLGALSILMRQTSSIFLDLFGSFTLENMEWARTIGMKTSGTPGHCTVLLGVTRSGEKVPPFIVLKVIIDEWMIRQLLAINLNKQISGFSEIILPSQGLGRPDCLFELDWAGLESLDSGIANRRANFLLIDEFLVHKVGKCVDPLDLVAPRSTIILPLATHPSFKYWKWESTSHSKVMCRLHGRILWFKI